MNAKRLRVMSLLIAVSVVLWACLPSATGTPTPTETQPSVEAPPAQVRGTYSVTNAFVLETYIVEHAVALLDMHGFVIRDREWELPVDSQVLGFMTFDPETLSGTFDLNLPVLPEGEFNDVDHDGEQDQGVQIFAVGYSPNLAGGPFSEGDDRSFGWPTYLASVKTDSENDDEVIGGKLIIWAPDANQQFPTGFGEDGLLFTEDDPVGPVPAGYSMVDLDKDPFEFSQSTIFEMTLLEPKEFELKDFSNQSYTEAFDNMFEFVRTNYAFNGIEGKEPDWDRLYAELRPRVEQAEKDKDAVAFFVALRDFTFAFKDGHVGLDGGEIGDQDFQNFVSGGYGFAIRELDDGRVIVVFVLEDGPAAQAGMQVGAEVTEFNGKPIGEAIAEVQPYAIQSSDWAIRYQQARYLLRTQPGTEATVTFINPGGEPQTVTLKAIAERESFARTSIYYGVEGDFLLPVEYRIIREGNAQIGYVSINSYYDDLNLIIRLFERALKQFTQAEVSGIIIDLRYNGGGNPLGLAGFLYDKEIPLGQAESFSEKTGKFEPEGPRDKVLPNVNQYRFDKMVLLVGPACASACDQEAYAFSQVPGMIVVGQYPTSGIFADVAKGQFALPEGFSLQVPTTRFTLPDGSLFLEGKGVPPTLKVPVDETTVFSEEDVVLQAAIRAVLEPLGAGITPSAPPKLATPEEALKALQAGTRFLEDAAREQYDAEDYAHPGTLTFTVALNKPETLIWLYAWCTTSTEILNQNFEHIKLKFVLDGEEIPLDQMRTDDLPNGDQQCRLYYTALSDWPAGEHHLSTTATFTQKINDGISDYEPGDYVLEYTVYVKP
ncbi:MAG TPA: S41 family peptidase [Anaerolineales bacterium]|nr:S41 family peptidase [Anaerolineales bacterium]